MKKMRELKYLEFVYNVNLCKKCGQFYLLEIKNNFECSNCEVEE